MKRNPSATTCVLLLTAGFLWLWAAQLLIDAMLCSDGTNCRCKATDRLQQSGRDANDKWVQR